MTIGDILNAFEVDYKLGLSLRPNVREANFRSNLNFMYRMFAKAQAEIQRKLLPLQKSSEISLVAGTAEYDLPSDFGVHSSVKSTVFGSDMFLKEIAIDDLGQLVTSYPSGETNYFGIYAPSGTHKIKVFPTPTNSGTLTVYYYVKLLNFGAADTIDLTDTFVLPDDYAEGVILFMLNDIFGDDLSYAKYREKLDSLKGSRVVSMDTNLTYDIAGLDV